MSNEYRTCNECEWYDPIEGLCSKDQELHRGFEDSCDQFELSEFSKEMEEWE